MSGKKPVWVDEQAHQLLKAWSKLKKSPMLALASNLVLEHLDLDAARTPETEPVKAEKAPAPAAEPPAVEARPADAPSAPAPPDETRTKAPAQVAAPEPASAAPEPASAAPEPAPAAPEPASAAPPREVAVSRPADAPRPASQKVAARGQSKSTGKRKELPGDELTPIEDRQNLFYGGVLILP